jgi:hypothetical protein
MSTMPIGAGGMSSRKTHDPESRLSSPTWFHRPGLGDFRVARFSLRADAILPVRDQVKSVTESKTGEN